MLPQVHDLGWKCPEVKFINKINTANTKIITREIILNSFIMGCILLVWAGVVVDIAEYKVEDRLIFGNR